jgi:D-glycero-alpha-D-manno-heptose-7-phosphate kinase
VSWIEVDPYPDWHRSQVVVPAAGRDALARRLLTVHLGGGHDSSALHRSVIQRAEAGDGDVARVLSELRSSAGEARDALAAGDLDRWGGVLSAATAAQGALHPDLVPADAREVIALAGRYGAAGAKVNGAGGAGGSVTLVAPEDGGARTDLRRALGAGGWSVLPLGPAPGVGVEVDDGPPRRHPDRGAPPTP